MSLPSDQAAADLSARLTDDRYGRDPAYSAEVDRAYQQAYANAGEASVQVVPRERTAEGPAGDLTARLKDDRYNPRSPKFDRAFAEETDRLFQQSPGERAPATSAEPPREFTGQVPTDISGYHIVSEKLAPFMPNLEGDGLFKDAKAMAQRAGLTDHQFNNFVGPMLERMAEAESMPGGGAPVDLRVEALKLVPPEAQHLDEPGQLAAAHSRIEAALNFVTGAEKQGLDPKVSEFLIFQLGDDPRGIQAIEFFQGQRGGARQGQNEQQQGERPNNSAALTDDDLTARANDPRGDPRSMKFSRAFAAETDRLFKARFG